MEPTNREKLEETLAKHENRQKNLNEQIERKKAERTNFLDKFEFFANSVIKPIMIEIGDILKDKGHDYNVTFHKEYKNEQGNIIDSRIIMDIFPNGKGRGSFGNVPAHILFHTETHSEKIGIHENNIVPGGGGGSAGKKSGKFTLDDLTTQIIEQEIIDTIGNIL